MKKKMIMKTSVNKFTIIISLSLFVIASLTIWFLSSSSILPEDIRHIVLISIDTCRADHLSCYGYPDKTTPNIDLLAEQATLFENVISPVPMTLPSHSSMLTGTIPVYHGVHDNLYYWLDESNVTIAEILKDKGFSTGSVISAFVLDSKFGTDQGFDTYNDTFEEQHMAGDINERKGSETSRFGIKWLEDNKDKKSFLFLHYFDPHSEYVPPEPFASEFANNPYAGEIAYTDYCIGQVIDKLKQLGLYGSTLIIITGDHGEMLGEHGEHSHSYFIYESAIRVPLIVKLPGQHKPRRVKNIIGLIDIVPTICSLLDIEPPKQVQGVDLSGFLGGQKAGYGDRFLYCESLTPTKYSANSLLGVVTDRYKYIQTTRPELYDLVKDPKENNNIIGQNHQRARILQDKLREILELSAGRGTFDNRIEVDAAAIKRLKSLGYIGGSVQEDFKFDQTKGDPKDFISLHKSTSKIDTLLLEKKYTLAKKLCERLVSQNPNSVENHLQLAEIAEKLNDANEMIAQYYEVLRLRPDHVNVHNTLGVGLMKLGRPDEAVKHLEETVRLRPKSFEALANLGQVLYVQEKLPEAVANFTKALAINPQMPHINYSLGKALLQQGKNDEAAANFTKALAINPQMPHINYSLGKALLQQGKNDEAIAQFKKELAGNPEHVLSHLNLGATLLDQGQIDEGIEHFEKALELKSDKPILLNRIGAQLAIKGKFDKAIKYFKRALEQDEQMADAHHNIAQVLLKQGKTAPAVIHFEKLLKINSEMFSVHNELAKISYQQGNIEKSIAHLSESVRIKPDQPIELDHLARALNEQGKIAEAVDYLNRVLEFRPDWPSVLNNLAWAKASGEDESLYDPNEAVRLARRACELTNFKDPTLLDTLAVAYSATGNFPEAVKTAEKAIELAQAANQEQLANEVQKRLELYKTGRVYRTSNPSEK